MALARPTAKVRALLNVTGLLRSQLFGVYDSLDEACAAVSE